MCSASGAFKKLSFEPHVLEAVVAEVLSGQAGNDAVELGTVGVDDGIEIRNHVPAVREVDHLHLMGNLRARRSTDSRLRLTVELDISLTDARWKCGIRRLCEMSLVIE